ncbi:MAG: MarR family winged helix-turn-helix transcriptional regulator [Chthoniobacterales bacterium]
MPLKIDMKDDKSVDLVLSEDEIARMTDIITILQRNFVLQLSERLSKGSISFSQLFLLRQLSASKRMSMSEIASKMSHTTAAATGLIDRLEKLTYVSRRRANAGADRRKVFVTITDSGEELVSSIKKEMQKNLARFMSHLEPHEQKTWAVISEKLFSYCSEQ